MRCFPFAFSSLANTRFCRSTLQAAKSLKPKVLKHRDNAMHIIIELEDRSGTGTAFRKTVTTPGLLARLWAAQTIDVNKACHFRLKSYRLKGRSASA